MSAARSIPRPGLRAGWRWLVLLLISFDLLTAPLHAHGHDLGPSQWSLGSGSSQALHGFSLEDAAAHAEAPPARLGLHSTAALRSVEHQPEPPRPPGASAPPTLPARRPAPLATAPARECQCVHPPAVGAGRLRPEGRAPPLSFPA